MLELLSLAKINSNCT